MSNDFNNPYSPPSSNVQDVTKSSGTEGFLTEPRAVPAGNCTKWIGDSWNLYKQQPLLFTAFAVAYGIVYFIISCIPFIGPIAAALISPIVTAGFMLCAEKQRSQGGFSFADLVAGFQKNTTQLLIIGAIPMILAIIMAILGVVLGAGSASLMAASNPDNAATHMAAFGGVMMLTLFIGLIGSLIIAVLIYLAPVLIILHNFTWKDAISLSLRAFTKNIPGAILCGVLLGIIAFVAMIPIGLGLFVVGPMTILLPYVVYRDLFFEEN